MKTKLLLVILAFYCFGASAQNPTITGQQMLCPDAVGTASITSGGSYDSYQWQFRFSWETAFQDIMGATSPTFTYDAYNYSVTDIRVKVTTGTSTYFSNFISIDSYVFLPIYTIQDFDPSQASIDSDGTLLLCQGAAIEFSVGMPYDNNVQWFNGGIAIAGANATTLVVTQAGNYSVSAAPSDCPESAQTSLGTLVEMDPNCSLSVHHPENPTVSFYPNPVVSELHFSSKATVSSISIYDISGKLLLHASPQTANGNLDLTMLSSGIYIGYIQTETETKTVKFVKQ